MPFLHLRESHPSSGAGNVIEHKVKPHTHRCVRVCIYILGIDEKSLYFGHWKVLTLQISDVPVVSAQLQSTGVVPAVCKAMERGGNGWEKGKGKGKGEREKENGNGEREWEKGKGKRQKKRKREEEKGRGKGKGERVKAKGKEKGNRERKREKGNGNGEREWEKGKGKRKRGREN